MDCFSAYVIKDIETGEYLCKDLGPSMNSFSFDLVYAHIFSNIHTADMENIGSKHLRWEEGYRKPRQLRVVEIEIKEVE